MDIREVLREVSAEIRDALDGLGWSAHPGYKSWATRIESALASLPAEAQGAVRAGTVAHFEGMGPSVTGVIWVGLPKPEPGAAVYLAAAPAVKVPSDSEDAAKYRALNTPEIADFLKAVEREALHQRDRWAAEHDAGKADSDWFWLIGFLAGKALHKPEKMLHHIVTTAAACLNWHAARVGAHTAMRPGIAAPAHSEDRET